MFIIPSFYFFFFFNDTAPTEIYTLPLHDALPISMRFLDAQGALVALAAEGEGGGERPLHVTAAEGTLAGLAGRAIAPTDPGLVVRSLSRERLELVRSSSGEPPRPPGGGGGGPGGPGWLGAAGAVGGAAGAAEPAGRPIPPRGTRS